MSEIILTLPFHTLLDHLKHLVLVTFPNTSSRINPNFVFHIMYRFLHNLSLYEVCSYTEVTVITYVTVIFTKQQVHSQKKLYLSLCLQRLRHGGCLKACLLMNVKHFLCMCLPFSNYIV